MANRKFTHVDCFAGPGGICTGLHASGFQTLVAIEYIKSCCETYSANHPKVHVIWSDIRKVTADQVLPHIPIDGVDLVTSGMPCETFSTAGNSSRSFYDDRQVLYREGIRMAKLCNAKMLLSFCSSISNPDEFFLIPDRVVKLEKSIDRDRFIKCVCPKTPDGFHNYINHYFNKRVFKTI